MTGDSVQQIDLGGVSIVLPPRELYAYTSFGMMYGADRVASSHCSIRRVPSRVRGLWQHGWMDVHRNIDPYQITDYVEGPEGLRTPRWVARRDQAEYLNREGFAEVSAIGLPIVYLAAKPIRRCRGTLLVMPVHSVDASQHRWPVEEYAEAIASVRDRFQEVVVCVHHSCFKHGNWTDSFRRRGFQVISGARYDDRNAFERLRLLFSTFEYVTTNGLGSQVAYAAYFGAKVSLFGPIAEYRREDFVASPVHARMRNLDILLEMSSERWLRRNYADHFCDPDRAILRTEWASAQLGVDCKVSPNEMRHLFGWSRREIVCSTATDTLNKVRAATIRKVGHWRRMVTSRQYAELHRNFAPLKTMPPGGAGETILLGKPVRFVDSAEFLAGYEEVFQREIFRFSSASPCPRVIDWGAGIGLRVLYWKKLFARAKIVASESNPTRGAVLAYNCVGLEDTTVEAFPAGDALVVPDFKCVMPRLEALLNTPTDVLYLRVASGDVVHVERCVEQLKRVEHIAVEYRDDVAKPQALSKMLEILQSAGFRVHLHTLMKSRQPWYLREVQEVESMSDLGVYIFGFRTSV